MLDGKTKEESSNACCTQYRGSRPKVCVVGGDRVLQTSKSPKVKQFYVNTNVILKDPGKRRQ